MLPPKPPKLVIGASYVMVKCASCGEDIPLEPNPGPARTFSGLGKLNIWCPFCEKENNYPIDAMKTQVLLKLPPTRH